MRIEIVVEGTTEKAFIPKMREFFRTQIQGPMPALNTAPFKGRLPHGDALKRMVEKLLRNADHVVAITDVYPDHQNADEAKRKMRQWVGHPQYFHPHAAQYEFEAWLLPYWERIQELARHNQSRPGSNPESINHNNPPSNRIKEVFRRGHGRYGYVKSRDATRILRGQDLNLAIQQCSELKSLVNTILNICGGKTIP